MKYMKYVLAFIGMASLTAGINNLEYISEYNADKPVIPFIVIGVVCAIIFIGLRIREELNGEE